METPSSARSGLKETHLRVLQEIIHGLQIGIDSVFQDHLSSSICNHKSRPSSFLRAVNCSDKRVSFSTWTGLRGARSSLRKCCVYIVTNLDGSAQS